MTEYTQESNYLNALKDILENGKKRETRNATTISKFGITLNFDISTSFPLLTTKKMFWKGIYEELLWFIKGDTNSKNNATVASSIIGANAPVVDTPVKVYPFNSFLAPPVVAAT